MLPPHAEHPPSTHAYLATTPGGVFAVLATAADSGAEVTDVTDVMALQLLRLLLILLLAPLLARVLREDPDRAGACSNDLTGRGVVASLLLFTSRCETAHPDVGFSLYVLWRSGDGRQTVLPRRTPGEARNTPTDADRARHRSPADGGRHGRGRTADDAGGTDR